MGRGVVPADTARELAESIAGTAEPRTALQAVEVIRGWHETLRAISGLAESRIMAATHAIRAEHPEHEAFTAFVGAHLGGVLDAERAWLMSETWAVARKSRAVREFAEAQPVAAIEFVREFVDAGRMEQLELLDDTDRRIVELDSLGPRARREKLRELFALEPAPQGDTLAEVHEARTNVAARMAIRRALKGLRKLESDAAGIRGVLNEHRETMSDTQRRTVLAIVDQIYRSLDALSSQAQGHE